MTVFQHIAAECRDDRAFAMMVFVLSSWMAISFGMLALNVLDVLPPS